MWHVSLHPRPVAGYQTRIVIATLSPPSRWTRVRTRLGFPPQAPVPYPDRLYLIYAMPIPLIGRDLNVWRPPRPAEHRAVARAPRARHITRFTRRRHGTSGRPRLRGSLLAGSIVSIASQQTPFPG
jgi:hypothetical protein